MQTLFISENAFFAEDKKLSIISIFDQLFPEGIPAAKQFAISGIINGNPKSKLDLTLKLIDPKGKEAAPAKNFVVELSPSGVTNFVINVTLGFQMAGKYSFRLYENKDLIGEAMLLLQVPKGGQHGAGKPLSN